MHEQAPIAVKELKIPAQDTQQKAGTDSVFPQVRVEWKKGDPKRMGWVSGTIGRVGSLIPNIIIGTPGASVKNPRPDMEEYLRGKWDGVYLGEDPVVYANRSPLFKQLKRLFSSKRRMNPIQRIALGVPVTIAAQVSGLYRGDHYNPYAESTVVYHSNPAVAMHEVGHQEDFANKRFPGFRALARAIPLVAVVQELYASRNAMHRLETEEERDNAKKILEPAVGTYIAGIEGAIIGHIHARTSSRNMFFKENLPPRRKSKKDK